MQFFRTHRLSTLAVISLLVGLVITRIQFRAAGSVQLPQWTTIAFQNVPLQVQFPGFYRHRVEQVALPGVAGLVSQGIFIAQGKDGISYSLNVITYPTTLVAEGDGALRVELSRLVPGAALTSFERASVAGMDARDFVMQHSADGIYVQGRIIRKGLTLYTLSVIYPSGYFPGQEYNRFISSFVYAQ